MDVRDAEVAGLPPGNVRMPHDEVAAVWRIASLQDLASILDC